MRLEAVSIGSAVPRGDFEVVVHSVFSNAGNLQRRKGGRLLTIVTINIADLPQGIRVNAPLGFSFEQILNPGERVICTDSILWDEYRHLEINLNPARRWKCKLPFIDMKIPSVVQAWDVVRALLDERQRRLETEISLSKLIDAYNANITPTARKIQEHFRMLIEMTNGCVFASDAAVRGLIGLGSGLTPAGDDLMIGFLTGLHCRVGEIEKRMLFLSDLGKTITHLSKQTNDISRTYLYYAARGQVSSLLKDLADAIALGVERMRLLQLAENAMRTGYSSGMDTVTGLLTGLSAWQTE
jgi:hypothetical protein